MEFNAFSVGEVVAIDEHLGIIVELYGLQPSEGGRISKMASVEMSDGEIHEYLLTDLGRIVELGE